MVVNLQTPTQSNTDRDTIIDNTLKNWGYSNYSRFKLPSDASFRKYERVTINGINYILMDAPPATEDVRPFIKIANILQNYGLKSPEILNSDENNGILLLEDFGSGKFNKIVLESEKTEETLYKNALDIIAHISMQQRELGIPEYNDEVLLREADLFIDWFLKYNENHSEERLKEIKLQYHRILRSIFKKLHFPNKTLVLRDYHADNLMVLDNDCELCSIGLLDFQDGLVGNISYDVVSLLEDARRDVSKKLQNKMIDYFVGIAGIKEHKQEFISDYNILGMQRNLKIIGIFTRLNHRDRKKHYLDLIPRVTGYLKQDLEHPVNTEIKEFLGSICKL